MKTLTIKDLARNEQLDGAALSAVRGGMKMSAPDYKVGDINYSPSYDSSIKGIQDLTQVLNVQNSVAKGSAFVENLNVTNNTDLFGQNNIVAHSYS